MKKIIICFDGTGNEPKDAEQKISSNGKLKDNNISNVLKLHLLSGGNIENTSNHFTDQVSFYYSGVGTRGNFLRRLVKKAIALDAPQKIMKEAQRDIEKKYRKNDSLYIFGFSRGAAIARMFASNLYKYGLQDTDGELDSNPKIEMLGVWDTVASFGKLNIISKNRPISDVIFEDNRISPAIRNAYHLVSIDENRLAFRPTLMNHQDNIQEVWFPGVHSNIGGGYKQSGLSDITLDFMLNAGKNHDLEFLSVKDIPNNNLQGIDQHGDMITIDRDDILYSPNSKGKLHKHKEFWRKGIKKFIMAPRDVVVVKNNIVSNQLPIVHYSAIERMNHKRKYKPYSLLDEDYLILDEHGNIQSK
ncbi:T6SS phospholipase effector Tle1-like catalytic domain-containing protein [Photobacterium proteolyticum]|nr:DUF2235 domain-containing protein [Photobacterium proteolyticum]